MFYHANSVAPVCAFLLERPKTPGNRKPERPKQADTEATKKTACQSLMSKINRKITKWRSSDCDVAARKEADGDTDNDDSGDEVPLLAGGKH
jgi:hypothetical protein